MQDNERFQPGSQIKVNMPNGHSISGTLLAWMSAGFLIETGESTIFIPYTSMRTASVPKGDNIHAADELAAAGVG